MFKSQKFPKFPRKILKKLLPRKAAIDRGSRVRRQRAFAIFFDDRGGFWPSPPWPCLLYTYAT